MGSPVRAWCLTPSHGWDVVVGITLAVLSAVPNFTFMPYYPSWSLPTSPLSTTFENGATATVENEAPRQIGWVISVEDWALIRRLVADGVPQRQVARDLGIGKPTVERGLASDRPPSTSVRRCRQPSRRSSR